MFLRVLPVDLLLFFAVRPLLLFLALIVILLPETLGIIGKDVLDVEDIVIVLGEYPVLPKQIEVFEFCHAINSYYILHCPTYTSIIKDKLSKNDVGNMQ